MQRVTHPRALRRCLTYLGTSLSLSVSVCLCLSHGPLGRSCQERDKRGPDKLAHSGCMAACCGIVCTDAASLARARRRRTATAKPRPQQRWQVTSASPIARVRQNTGQVLVTTQRNKRIACCLLPAPTKKQPPPSEEQNRSCRTEQSRTPSVARGKPLKGLSCRSSSPSKKGEKSLLLPSPSPSLTAPPPLHTHTTYLYLAGSSSPPPQKPPSSHIAAPPKPDESQQHNQLPPRPQTPALKSSPRSSLKSSQDVPRVACAEPPHPITPWLIPVHPPSPNALPSSSSSC